MPLSDASNSHTNFLRADDAPVRNLMGHTAADKARVGYRYWNPLTKVKVSGPLIRKRRIVQ